MLVSTGDYDALLGNDTLFDIHSCVDIDAEKLKFKHQGKKYIIGLSTTKGKRPPFCTAEEPEEADESDDAEEVRVAWERTIPLPVTLESTWGTPNQDWDTAPVPEVHCTPITFKKSARAERFESNMKKTMCLHFICF